MSLSKPHTSGTALCMCVCLFACLLAGCGHLQLILMECNYAQRLNVLDIHFSSVVSDREGPLPECRKLEWRWLKLKHAWELMSRLSQLGPRQQALRQTLNQGRECTVTKVASCKGHTQTTLVNGRDSAHDWVWSLVRACVTIVAVLTDRRQSQPLLLFIV